MAGENQMDSGAATIDIDAVSMNTMFEQMERGEEINVPAEAATPPAAAAAPAPVEVKQQEPIDTPADPEGVATKDGRNIIPYSVLKSERERASRAEQAANEMKDRLTALEAQVKAGTSVPSGAATTTQPVEETMSAEDLEGLKEDFPTVYKGLMAMQAKAAKLEAQLKPVQEQTAIVTQERERSRAESVQEAIDNTPKLAFIATNDPAAYELATQFDNMLKGQAAWADKPLSERFAKVVELVEQTNGAITVPGSKVATPPAQTAEQLRAAAQQAAAASAQSNKTAVPTSLSEFPAGQHAAENEQAAVESMTTLQLADKFSRMSPDQMDAYLQSL